MKNKNSIPLPLAFLTFLGATVLTGAWVIWLPVPRVRGDDVLSLTSLYLLFLLFRTAGLGIFSFAETFFRKELPALRSFPAVTILVPGFNEEGVIQNSIRSLLNMDYPNLKILVIDDGSTDDTLARARELEDGRRVRVLHQANRGKAEALNYGLREAVGDYILCVDADGLLDPSAVRKALPHLIEDTTLAAVAGNVRVGNDRNLLTLFQRLEYIIGLGFYKSAQSFFSSVIIVPGPVGLFRKAAVLRVGGYRPTTFAEDCDLTVRLLLEGYGTVYCPEMVAVTEAPTDFGSLLKQRYRWTRGTIQVIKANWKKAFRGPRNFLLLIYFTIETLLIPTLNFGLAIAVLDVALLGGGSGLIGAFFLQLAALDVLVVAYCLISEPVPLKLLPLAFINRVTYGLSTEVLRFLALLDEVFDLPMGWNKLVRKGLS